MTVAGRTPSMLGMSTFFEHRLSAFREVTSGFCPGRLMICLGSSSEKNCLAGSRKAPWEPQCWSLCLWDHLTRFQDAVSGSAGWSCWGLPPGERGAGRTPGIGCTWLHESGRCTAAPGTPWLARGIIHHPANSSCVWIGGSPVISSPTALFQIKQRWWKTGPSRCNCVMHEAWSPGCPCPGMRFEVCSSVERGPCPSLTLKEPQRQYVGSVSTSSALVLCIVRIQGLEGRSRELQHLRGRRLPWRWHPGLVLLQQPRPPAPSRCPTGLLPPPSCPEQVSYWLHTHVSWPLTALSNAVTTARDFHLDRNVAETVKRHRWWWSPALWFDWLRLYSHFFKTCLWNGVACARVSLELTVGAGDAGAGPEFRYRCAWGSPVGSPSVGAAPSSSSSRFQPGGGCEGRDPSGGICSWLGQRFPSGC